MNSRTLTRTPEIDTAGKERFKLQVEAFLQERAELETARSIAAGSPSRGREGMLHGIGRGILRRGGQAVAVVVGEAGHFGGGQLHLAGQSEPAIGLIFSNIVFQQPRRVTV